MASERRFRPWLIVAGLAVVLTGHSALAQWRETHAVMINSSQSLPNWAFYVEKNKTPTRGDYVFFSPPRSPLLVRHFGEKPQAFGKQILGMPGDVVSHKGTIVRVNGREVARMKPLTRTGEPLHRGPVGRVPEGCYYAGTGHKDGFDSRYAEIGFVCARQLIGTGSAIL